MQPFSILLFIQLSTFPSIPLLTMSKPSQEEILAVLDCFRYGDLEEGDFEDIKKFTSAYGDQVLAELRDDRGNTALHMAGGNGHAGKSCLSCRCSMVEKVREKLPTSRKSSYSARLL